MNIPDIKYTDFLINQIEPERNDSTYIPFWLKHIEYCKSGVNVGGVYISGWLYWHINFFKLTMGEIDEYGNQTMVVKTPKFRDNEFYFEHYFRETDSKDKEPLIAFGTRRFAKTALISSRMAYKAFIFKNSHEVIVGASKTDINNIIKYFNEFYEKRPDCFSDLQKLGDFTREGGDLSIAFSKRKVMSADKVTKEKGKINPITTELIDIGKDDTYLFSKLSVRNLEHGQVKSKEEMLAGITPTGVIWDEALWEEEDIPTYNGFKKVKDVTVGDKIIGKDGMETTVVEKINVGHKDLFDVELLDGRTIKTCGEHMWEVWDNKLNKYRQLRTHELINTCTSYQNDKRYSKQVKKRRYSIDLCEPVRYPKNELLFNPYYFGLWLGDGDKKSATIYTVDNGIKEFVKRYADELNFKFSLTTGNNGISICRIFDKIGAKNPLISNLRRLDVFDNKHIPEQYLLSSIHDRRKLLAGMLDTDGTITKHGNISYTTVSTQIKEGFLKLVSSLGIRYSVSEGVGRYKKNGIVHITQHRYDIRIYPKFNPFILKRKAERFIKHGSKKSNFYRTKVSIDSITPSFKGQAYCFKVDNSDSLFLTGRYVVTHNCGKYMWEKQHSALLPAIDGEFGKRCTEIFTGTGGEIEASVDAEKAFLAPSDTGFYKVDLESFIKTVKAEYFPYRHKVADDVGLFVPAEFSLAGGSKIEIPLSEYLNRSFSKKELEALDGFNIGVTNWEEARKRIDKTVEREKKKSDAAYKKAQMYYPYQPEDCFLYSGSNPFPVEELKKRKKYLEESGLTGEFVDLSKNRQGMVAITPSKKDPILAYPFEGGSHDAPVKIFERPIHDNPMDIKKGVYVAGFDGYKIGVSETTDSVGSMFIFKRKSGIQGMQHQIVASYASRPAEDKIFHRQCLLMLQLYNAEVLPEVDTSFYKYMEGEHALAKHWANCKDLAQGINVNTKANTDYGLPATVKNQQHFLKLIKQYCNESIIVGYEEDETPITMLGCHRLMDITLIDELISFGKEKNFDRIIAFGHALAWDNELGVNNIIGDDGKRSTQVNIQRLKQKAKYRTSTNRWKRRSKYRR